MFKKKPKINEVAEVKKDVVEEPKKELVEEPRTKLLIELTEPESFIHIYSEINEIKNLLAELVEIAKKV